MDAAPQLANDDRARANAAMERYADGDEAAFDDLWDVLSPRLRRFVVGLSGADAAADDVIQQTFLRIMLSRDRFCRGAAVLPWAFAIAHNLVRDLARRSAREASAVDRATSGDSTASAARPPDEALDDKRRDLALHAALLELPEKLRAAFLLVKDEGMSVAEAAAALGISRANVKVRVFRARQLLLDADARREGSPPVAPAL